MMLTKNNILNNAELVKDIEGKVNSMNLHVITTETNYGKRYKIGWPKFKQN